MMPRRKFPACVRRTESGAMALMMVMTILGVATLVFGVFMLGCLVVHRQQAQNAADAVALADAWGVLSHPLSGDVGNAQAGGWIAETDSLVTGNTQFDVQTTARTWVQSCQTGQAWAEAQLRDDSVWSLAGFLGNTALGFDEFGRAEVFEDCPGPIVVAPPRLMLVLDYSPSMRCHFLNDTNQVAIQVLKNSVHTLLTSQGALSMVDIGAVLFRDQILWDMAPVSGNTANRTILDQTIQTTALTCPQSSGQCKTDFARAIDRATVLMDQYPVPPDPQVLPCLRESARYLWFVSEGDPRLPSSSPAGAARLAANAAKGPPNNIELWTFEVQRVGDTTARVGFTQLMDDVASHGSDCSLGGSCHILVDNALTMSQIANPAVSLSCTTRPLQTYVGTHPEDNWPIFAYQFINGQGETPIERVWSFAALDAQGGGPAPPAFFFEETSSCIFISETACQSLLDGTATLRVRFGEPRPSCRNGVEDC